MESVGKVKEVTRSFTCDKQTNLPLELPLLSNLITPGLFAQSTIPSKCIKQVRSSSATLKQKHNAHHLPADQHPS